MNVTPYLDVVVFDFLWWERNLNCKLGEFYGLGFRGTCCGQTIESFLEMCVCLLGIERKVEGKEGVTRTFLRERTKVWAYGKVIFSGGLILMTLTMTITKTITVMVVLEMTTEGADKKSKGESATCRQRLELRQ